jgi:hypothetical protein
MKKIWSSVKSHEMPFPRLSLKAVLLIITVFAFSVGMFSIDSTCKNLDPKTVQQKCIPDMGTNISKFNCSFNAASAPVYNMTSTENVRPHHHHHHHHHRHLHQNKIHQSCTIIDN